MPSFLHEGLIALFRLFPDLAPHLLQQTLHVPLPAYSQIRLEEADFTQLVPAQYRADLVVLLVDGVPVFGIIVEVQLSRDDDKRYTWPLYALALRARLRCPTCVLVVAPDNTVAAWARESIVTGQPQSVFVPLVLGSEALPHVSELSPERAAPEVVALASLAHGVDLDAVPVVLATLAAAAGLSDEMARLVYDLIWASMGEASREALERLMRSGTYQYQSDFAKKYVAEGQAKGEAIGEARGEARGEAKALLTILTARDMAPTEDQRVRILACQDLDTLEQWLRLALTATSVADIIG